MGILLNDNNDYNILPILFVLNYFGDTIKQTSIAFNIWINSVRLETEQSLGIDA